MKNILDQNFEGKRVIVRVDFNVPLDGKFNITDGSRIKAALPTINKLLSDKARVILMSHLGRPKGKEDKFSLRHVVNYLQELLGVVVSFSNDCIGPSAKKAVSKPIIKINVITKSDITISSENLTVKKTPAVTMVAA